MAETYKFLNETVQADPTTGQVISIDKLNQEQPITIPEYSPDLARYDSLNAGISAGLGSLDSFLQSLTPQPTELDRTEMALIDRYNELLPQTAGRQQALIQEQQKQGAPELQKQLQNLRGQLDMGLAEAAILSQEEQRQSAELEANAGKIGGITTGVLTGQQLANARLFEARKASKSAENALTAARANAVAGNLQVALKLADSAVEAKFAPIEDELRIRQAQLDAIKPLIERQRDREGKAFQVRLQERQRQIEDERQKIADEKAQQKAISEMIVNASSQGAPADLVDKASNAKNSIEAAKILGKFSGDYLKYELLKEQILTQAEQRKTERAQQANYYANVAKTKAEIAALQPGAPGSIPPQYQGALDVILGSDKFTKEQKTSITNAIKNGQDPFSVIKNQAKNIMGQTQATNLSKLETATSQIKSIDELLKQYYKNGGKTGLFKGNFEKVVNKLGQVKEPELVSIASEIALAMQEYRLAVTGTAASVKEDSKIESVFPGINNSQGLNQAKVGALIKSFDQKIDAEYTNVLGSSYAAIKNSLAASDPNNPFSQAIGGSTGSVPGTSIIKGINPDGTLNFNIPGYQSGVPSVPRP